MSTEASAIPSQLTGWSGWATQQNGDLSAAARRLNTALEHLNQAKNSGYVLGQVDYAGNDVLGYAARNQTTDDWVGSVGRAFAEESRHGIPPQIYKMEYRDILNSKVTTTDGAITSKVGGDPVTAGQQNAQAVELAARLREAEDTNNGAQVQAIIAELDGHQLDPTFSAAFFNELGPGGVSGTIWFISNEKDPNNVRLLKIFDTALASATDSPNWNPDFTNQLWPGPTDPGWKPSVMIDMLALKYAQTPFSEDFLTKAADSTLFFPENHPGTTYPEFAAIVFNALAQNPGAALHYMIGNGPNGTGGQSRSIRMVDLLRQYQSDLRSNQDGGMGPALANLIAQAGAAPDARQPYVGPFGTEPRIQVLFHTLTALPEPWMPDSIRPGIARAISENIDLFLPVIDPKHPKSPEVGADWSWQEKIFKAAVADNRGNVNLDGVHQIQDAIQQWALTHVPPVNPNDAASLDTFRAYMYQVGTLWALAALPVRQGGYDKDHFREQQIDGIKMLIGLIPIPVPLKDEGAKKLTEYVVDHVDEWAREIGANAAKKAGGNPDKESAEVYYRQLGDLRLMLATQFAAQHPGLLSGKTSQDAGEYIHQLADGTDPSGGTSADVANFEAYLDSASIAFSDQYQNPGRK